MKTSDLRTPLARARGWGSAKDGTHHWWMQRVTSVLLIPLMLYLLFHLGTFLPHPYALNGLIAAVATPTMTLALLLTAAVAAYHGWLGIRVVIEDYIPGEGAKMACLLANIAFFFFAGMAGIFAVLYINFALAAQMGR